MRAVNGLQGYVMSAEKYWREHVFWYGPCGAYILGVDLGIPGAPGTIQSLLLHNMNILLIAYD
jgi:hypothetical protein